LSGSAERAWTLGADEEMTKLVLASHCQNRTLLDDMVANGDDLRDYVRHKLAIWEAILNEAEMSNGVAGATPASKLAGLGDPAACERAPANGGAETGTQLESKTSCVPVSRSSPFPVRPRFPFPAPLHWSSPFERAAPARMLLRRLQPSQRPLDGAVSIDL
jgi:hypothetical protein